MATRRQRSQSKLPAESQSKLKPATSPQEGPIIEAEVIQEPVDEVNPSEKDNTHEVNLALETKVNELSDALEKAKRKEEKLQKIVDDLQAQLDEQTKLVQNLQTSVEKANSIQSEFQKAQKTALQLAEANQKLIEENNTLKNENFLLQQTPQKLEKQPDKSNSNLSTTSQTDLRSQQEILRKRQAAALAHPVFPNDPAPSQLNDQDIGWVD